MTRKLFALSTIALVALTMSCSQAPKSAETHDTDVQALKDIEAQWNKDYEAKDLDKIVGHYTDDAVLMAPGTAPAVGKDAIRSGLKQMVADPALSLKFEATRVEVASGGGMAYTQGSYTMTMTDPSTKKPINDKGSYVTVYKKQADSSWKAVSDIASSATPPGPAPAQGK
ncbi:MAG: SgcJ/EcaC family oxidoreductase [Terriglobia bacterium]|jgi:uncharacterized protein (TIGR02246 family)